MRSPRAARRGRAVPAREKGAGYFSWFFTDFRGLVGTPKKAIAASQAGPGLERLARKSVTGTVVHRSKMRPGLKRNLQRMPGPTAKS